MQRGALRLQVNGTGMDVPVGAFGAGQLAKFDGSQLLGSFSAVAASSADQTIGSVTQTALTGLSFALPGAGTYAFRYVLQTATNTAAATQVFSVSYSGSVTGGIANAFFTTTATTFATASTTTFTTGGTMAGTRTTLTTPFMTVVEGIIVVSTAGTLQLNGASGVAADALVVMARSGGTCVQQ